MLNFLKINNNDIQIIYLRKSSITSLTLQPLNVEKSDDKYVLWINSKSISTSEIVDSKEDGEKRLNEIINILDCQ